MTFHVERCSLSATTNVLRPLPDDDDDECIIGRRESVVLRAASGYGDPIGVLLGVLTSHLLPVWGSKCVVARTPPPPPLFSAMLLFIACNP